MILLLFLLLSGAETPCFLSYTKFNSPSIFLSLKFSRFLLKRLVSADQLFRYLDAVHGRGGDSPCIACPFPAWKKGRGPHFQAFHLWESEQEMKCGFQFLPESHPDSQSPLSYGRSFHSLYKRSRQCLRQNPAQVSKPILAPESRPNLAKVI